MSTKNPFRSLDEAIASAATLEESRSSGYRSSFKVNVSPAVRLLPSGGTFISAGVMVMVVVGDIMSVAAIVVINLDIEATGITVVAFELK